MTIHDLRLYNGPWPLEGELDASGYLLDDAGAVTHISRRKYLVEPLVDVGTFTPQTFPAPTISINDPTPEILDSGTLQDVNTVSRQLVLKLRAAGIFTD